MDGQEGWGESGGTATAAAPKQKSVYLSEVREKDASQLVASVIKRKVSTQCQACDVCKYI